MSGTEPDRRRVCALGRRLRAEREARQMSQQVLAARAGVERAHVASVEDGTQDATLALLWRLCDALGVTLAALFDGLEQE